MKYLLLDTETTGLQAPELIEIAQVPLCPEVKLLKKVSFAELEAEIYHERFKPSKPIDERASKVHGIYAKHLWNCRKSATYQFPEPTEVLLGHNIKFDHRVLGEPDVKLICTMQLAKKVFPEIKKEGGNYKLTDLIIRLYPETGLQYTRNAHGARADVILTFLLLLKILDKLPKLESLEQLVPLCTQTKPK